MTVTEDLKILPSRYAINLIKLNLLKLAIVELIVN